MKNATVLSRTQKHRISTTEIYARASTEAKRKALEAVYDQAVSADLTEWNQDPELLTWLTSL